MIPLLLPSYLAQTDTMVPGSFITGFVVAVLPAVAGALVVWKKAQDQVKRLKLDDPVPEVPVKRVYSPPSYYQHKSLEERVGKLEGRFTVMERDQADRFLKLMNAGEERKERILDKMDEQFKGVYQRINQITDTLK